MTGLKKCVAIINNRSGHRHGVHAYSETLKHYMNRAGIVHHDIHIPNDDMAETLRRMLPTAEALIICGGDGTVNSAVNLMASLSASAATPASSTAPAASSLLAEKPLLLVPTGLHNSIAVSLGVVSAERAISSLVVGRTVRVPLWAVQLRPPRSAAPAAVRYMCSYVAAGTYAAMVRRQARWKEAQEEYVSLPAVFGTLAATSLFTSVEHGSPHCTLDLLPTVKQENGTGRKQQLLQPQQRLGPLRMIVAAQLPQLQPGYSLTPNATYHQRRLTVATAGDEASRLRMWHLLRREAREGYVLEEDGVAVHQGVQGLRIEFPAGPAAAAAETAKDKKKLTDSAEEEEGVEDSALLVLDGECVRVPHGSVITVTPTDLTAQFIVS